ncbi:hypothetical protein GALMADRAFT_1163435 [Galerina marginata CBS 339.88]|uniref:Uncharacterized protein n=1 Tax=Galerina marginata (strain CBS 339.88) TaxID=685588 RepID=A0A067TIM6_GALM3|nr:hypothetical protein GALMADRAFT_1163435 [Galerina marginata CBS 339.88]
MARPTPTAQAEGTLQYHRHLYQPLCPMTNSAVFFPSLVPPSCCLFSTCYSEHVLPDDVHFSTSLEQQTTDFPAKACMPCPHQRLAHRARDYFYIPRLEIWLLMVSKLVSIRERLEMIDEGYERVEYKYHFAGVCPCSADCDQHLRLAQHAPGPWLYQFDNVYSSKGQIIYFDNLYQGRAQLTEMSCQPANSKGLPTFSLL